MGLAQVKGVKGMINVVKRDGEIVDFNLVKISDAVAKA